jgi:hypothetical protein
VKKIVNDYRGENVINGHKMEWVAKVETSFAFRKIRQKIVYMQIKKDGHVTSELGRADGKIKKPDFEDEETHVAFTYATDCAIEQAMKDL